MLQVYGERNINENATGFNEQVSLVHPEQGLSNHSSRGKNEVNIQNFVYKFFNTN